jgi:hypothetical protein
MSILLTNLPQFPSKNTQSLHFQWLTWMPLGLAMGFFAVQFPSLFAGMAIALFLHFHFPTVLPKLLAHPFLQRHWRAIGTVAGVVLFLSIIHDAEPASAQLFKTVEDKAQSLFGSYLDGTIITFLFGLLRIIIWVSAIGYIFFAVYQAQRGEQWQPLIQNAFIVVAAVVVVEGLSALFFGK